MWVGGWGDTSFPLNQQEISTLDAENNKIHRSIRLNAYLRYNDYASQLTICI